MMAKSGVLLVGAGGQLGREIVARAGARPLVALDRAALDITDVAAVRRAFAQHRPAVLINAAAYTAVDRAQSEPARAYAVNRDGAGHLASVCAEHDVPLLHVSTDYVFDGAKATPYREDDVPAPLGVYGDSKWQGEQAIRRALSSHLILRVAWVFGAHGHNFVKTMLRLAAEREELRVVADQRGRPTHAGSIAEALFALADRVLAGEALRWGTYHYAGAPATTWHGFAESIIEEAWHARMLLRRPRVVPITTAEYPTPARRPANAELDCTLAGDMLALSPSPWITGLREMLANPERMA